MNINNQTILSDFLRHNIKCDDGFNYGQGYMVWMHPPVHRVLGWISKPSALSLSRYVWSLNQLKFISANDVYVKYKPSLSNQETLDRFPTLINAQLLNINREKIASITDLVFNSISGEIYYYLVSRTNPKIPGTSRWSLKINQITDQQPGSVFTNLSTIDDLPLIKASIREELIRKSKNLKTQIEDITNIASNKLEGWLEENAWEEENKFSHSREFSDNWIDNDENIYQDDDLQYNKKDSEYDPWI